MVVILWLALHKKRAVEEACGKLNVSDNWEELSSSHLEVPHPHPLWRPVLRLQC